MPRKFITPAPGAIIGNRGCATAIVAKHISMAIANAAILNFIFIFLCVVFRMMGWLMPTGYATSTLTPMG
jgi:hypothetical protein